MTDARTQLIELMRNWNMGLAKQNAETALDALLSDEGRPLLRTLMDEADPPYYNFHELKSLVEYLRERGVLVPYGQRCAWDDETEQDVAIPLCELRLPGETKP